MRTARSCRSSRAAGGHGSGTTCRRGSVLPMIQQTFEAGWWDQDMRNRGDSPALCFGDGSAIAMQSFRLVCPRAMGE
jgi:hypothetical protein